VLRADRCPGTESGIGNVPAAADIGLVKLRYVIGGLLVAGMLALPASAAAGPGSQITRVAAQQCAQQRVDIGRRAFRKRYGVKHTMRNCIRRNRTRAASTLNSATNSCEQELADNGPDEFILDYAIDEDTLEDAMSECIAESVDELLDPSDSSDDGSDEVE
jgi:hypothetical protein